LQQTICVCVIYLAMTSMACFNVASDLAMFTASVILLATEVITRDEFLQGFGNSSVVCVGLLLVVAKGVEETGALERLVKFCLGKPKNRVAAQLVMMVPVLLISAFLSNTACVGEAANCI
jgi:di/tricarboxylate transporter